MGQGGDLIVTYQTFQCKGSSCFDFKLFAAREALGGAWQHPLQLASASSKLSTLPIVDPQGNAAVVFEPYEFADSLSVTLQGANARRWTAPVAVYTGPGGERIALLGGAVDASGEITLLFLEGVAGDASPSILYALPGQTSPGSWGSPIDATGDPNLTNAAPVAGTNDAGGAVLGWTDSDGSLHVTAKDTSADPWEAPQELLGPTGTCRYDLPALCQTVTAASIDDAGHAVAVLFGQQTLVYAAAR